MSDTKYSHLWTKDELRSLKSLWEKCTVEEIAEKMGLSRKQVTYMAWSIRKKYPEALTRKRITGVNAKLIAEIFG